MSARWGRGLGPPRHVSADGRLADFDAELEQFAMDARRAPKRIGEAHLTDQIADLGRSSGRPRGRDRQRQ